MNQHERPSRISRNIAIAFSITAAFFVVELVGGILTNSLALTADAWHMLTDASALLFALVAAWISTRPDDLSRTFGYYRTEILAAFLNGIFLCAVVGFIFYDAIGRLQNPSAVAASEMLVIAALGLIVNGLSAAILSRSRSESLNVKGAFLHVVSDLIGSVAVIAAGLIMYSTKWYPADPIFSIAVAILILQGALSLIRESANILLEGVPRGIDVTLVQKRIFEQKGVKNVHDLHVWCMTPSRICALSCHIVMESDVDRKKLTSDLIGMLQKEFGIDHTTIQLEEEGYPKAVSEH